MPKTHIYTGDISIRWRDIDPYGILNHAVYLTLLEEVRINWLIETGFYDKLDVVFPIVNLECNYLKKVTYPANMQVRLYSDNISSKKWEFLHELVHKNTPDVVCAEVKIISVVYDPKKESLVPMPDEIKNALVTPYEKL